MMENLPSKRPKKQRELLTLEKKTEIIKFTENHPELAQETIGKIFNIERSTVSKILSKKSSILEFCRMDSEKQSSCAFIFR